MALRLDAQGREVDEHGHVLATRTKAVATLKVNVTQQKVAEFTSQAKADQKAINTAEPKQVKPRTGPVLARRGGGVLVQGVLCSGGRIRLTYQSSQPRHLPSGSWLSGAAQPQLELAHSGGV